MAGRLLTLFEAVMVLMAVTGVVLAALFVYFVVSAPTPEELYPRHALHSLVSRGDLRVGDSVPTDPRAVRTCLIYPWARNVEEMTRTDFEVPYSDDVIYVLEVAEDGAESLGTLSTRDVTIKPIDFCVPRGGTFRVIEVQAGRPILGRG